MQALRGNSYRHHARPPAQVDVQRLGLYDPAADQHTQRVLGEPVCASWSSRKTGCPLLPCNMMARAVGTESWLPAPNPTDLRGEKRCSQQGAGQGNGASRQTLAVTSGRPKARSGASRCVPRLTQRGRMAGAGADTAAAPGDGAGGKHGYILKIIPIC